MSKRKQRPSDKKTAIHLTKNKCEQQQHYPIRAS